jgi:hypothetical protein
VVIADLTRASQGNPFFGLVGVCGARADSKTGQFDRAGANLPETPGWIPSNQNCPWPVPKSRPVQHPFAWGTPDANYLIPIPHWAAPLRVGDTDETVRLDPPTPNGRPGAGLPTPDDET